VGNIVLSPSQEEEEEIRNELAQFKDISQNAAQHND
jgi:hypothetical protein